MSFILYTIRAATIMIVDPRLSIVILILGIMFYFKNKNVAKMQKKIMGEVFNSPLELTLSQIALGILSGYLGSIILNSLGVVFSNKSGIQMVFIISVIMMFIKPRFACFSYVGSAYGIASMLINMIGLHIGRVFLNVDIMELITFIGVMHIIEGILVIIDGDRGSVPIFKKIGNNIIGGYAMNRFWIITVSLTILMPRACVVPSNIGAFSLPGWWPIITNEAMLNLMAASIMMMLPFYGITRYSSVTFTKTKKDKTRENGIGIIIFGMIVCFIGEFSKFGIVFKIAGLILVPIGHELMLKVHRRLELKRKAIFRSFRGNLCILDVCKSREVYKLGVRPGNRIIRIEGKDVETEKDLYNKYIENLPKVHITVVNEKKIKEIIINKKIGQKTGIIVVPVAKENKFSKVLNKKKEKLVCKEGKNGRL